MKSSITPAVLAATLAAAALLAGCGEKAQTAATPKFDGKPWDGANASYVAQGWKPGDRASWEQQMRKRSQGQDEYSRASVKP